MELTEEEKRYIRIYKGVDDYLARINVSSMEPLKQLKVRLRYDQLSYRNINMFLNFINNPDAIKLDYVMVEDVNDIVEMIKSLISVSCKATLSYQPQETLYRYENINNINAYANGNLSSFKSTSWNISSAEEFKKYNTVLLEYNIGGFCPVIPIDKVIDGGLLSDEHEFLLPPYLDCYMEGNKVKVGFNDDNKIDETDYNYYNMIYMFNKDSFTEQFKQDKEKGIASEQLKEQCEILKGLLSTYARLNYRHYEQLYNNNSSKNK